MSSCTSSAWSPANPVSTTASCVVALPSGGGGAGGGGGLLGATEGGTDGEGVAAGCCRPGPCGSGTAAHPAPAAVTANTTAPATTVCRNARWCPRRRTSAAGANGRGGRCPRSAVNAASNGSDIGVLHDAEVEQDGERPPAPGQPGLHGALRGAGLPRDLLDGQSDQVVQDDRGALFHRQPGQGAHQCDRVGVGA